ncbi:MAG: glycosyltransferase family 2 protein [Oscillospiraceae bacterium]
MTYKIFTVLLNFLFIASSLFTLYGAYFFIIAIFGFKKPPQIPNTKPKTRFAIAVAARNEEVVICDLIQSLQAQNYPAELYDIYIAPNNCTDNTRQAALDYGAKIFDPVGPIHIKGEVLTQITGFFLSENRYDALCVFDADNLVHPDFLQRMNDAYQRGVRAAQGCRTAKNPVDSAMTICYSIYYWVVNRLYNGGREALGLSSLIVGSGYMVSMDLLRRLGGWHTSTLTEDYEFSAQCVLHGEKIHYVADAIVYDELPLTFGQSWKQRRRWSTGFVQGMEIYMHHLFRYAVQKSSPVAFDLALAYIAPLIQLISLVLGVASFLLSAYGVLELNLMPVTQAALWLLAGALLLFLGCTIFAAVIMRLHHKQKPATMAKGVVLFAVFLISFVPIGLLSLFNKKIKWEEIKHTRSANLKEME